jgi:hypothetical protein
MLFFPGSPPFPAQQNPTKALDPDTPASSSILHYESCAFYGKKNNTQAPNSK